MATRILLAGAVLVILTLLLSAVISFLAPFAAIILVIWGCTKFGKGLELDSTQRPETSNSLDIVPVPPNPRDAET